jgi:hypothetical protein
VHNNVSEMAPVITSAEVETGGPRVSLAPLHLFFAMLRILPLSSLNRSPPRDSLPTLWGGGHFHSRMMFFKGTEFGGYPVGSTL